MLCKKCGKEVNPADGYCRNCGEKIVDSKPIRHPCTYCGTLNSKSAKFCKFCGRMLDLSLIAKSEPKAAEPKKEDKVVVKPQPIKEEPKKVAPKAEVVKAETKATPTPKAETKATPTPKVEEVKEEFIPAPIIVSESKVEMVVKEPEVVVEEKAVATPKTEEVVVTPKIEEENIVVVSDNIPKDREAVKSEEGIVIVVNDSVPEEKADHKSEVENIVVISDSIPEEEAIPTVSSETRGEQVEIFMDETAYGDQPQPNESSITEKTKAERRIDRLRMTSKVIAGILMLVSVAMLLLSGLVNQSIDGVVERLSFFDIVNPQNLMDRLDLIAAAGDNVSTSLLVELIQTGVVLIAEYAAIVALGVMLIIGIIKFILLRNNRYSYVGGIAMKMFIVALAAIAVLGTINGFNYNDGEQIINRFSYLTLGLAAAGFVLLLIYLGLRTTIRRNEKLGAKGGLQTLVLYVSLLLSICVMGFMCLGTFHFTIGEFSGYHGGYIHLMYFADSTINADSYAALLGGIMLGETTEVAILFLLVFVMSTICSMIAKGKSGVVGLVFSILAMFGTVSHLVIASLTSVAFSQVANPEMGEILVSTNGIYLLCGVLGLMLLVILAVVLKFMIKHDRLRQLTNIV